MSDPTAQQIRNAALQWCGEKGRETFQDDILYFETNWRALPGMRSYVERECERCAIAAIPDCRVCAGSGVCPQCSGVGCAECADTGGCPLCLPVQPSSPPTSVS